MCEVTSDKSACVILRGVFIVNMLYCIVILSACILLSNFIPWLPTIYHNLHRVLHGSEKSRGNGTMFVQLVYSDALFRGELGRVTRYWSCQIVFSERSGQQAWQNSSRLSDCQAWEPWSDRKVCRITKCRGWCQSMLTGQEWQGVYLACSLDWSLFCDFSNFNRDAP